MFRKAATLLVLGLVFTAIAVAAGPRDRTPPTTPTNLRITAVGPKSVSLAWNKSTDNSSNWWYCVQLSGSGCFRVNPPQTTWTHPLLMPGRTYSFSVMALDAAGNRSGSSNTVTATTPPDTTPPSPAPVVSATYVRPTRIGVTWTAAKDDFSQVYYTLLVDGSPFGGNLIGFLGVTALDLAPESTHTFKVIAADVSGNRVESNVLTVTTPPKADNNPPTAPTNFRLSSESQANEIWLDWDQSTDDTDPQSELLYRVFQNGDPVGELVAFGRGDGLVYCQVEGAVNTLVLRAVDSSGNVSAPSNQISFPC